MESAEAPPLEIGGTLARAFALIGQFPLRIFGVAFLCGAVPTHLVYYAISIQTAHGISRSLSSFETGFISEISATVVAGLLIGTAGNDAGVAAGFRRLPQLVAAGLLKGLGSMLAAAALLVPYFFVATRWSVVGAVVASEEVGINAAFGRSSDLTDGVRLRILGLLMVSGVGQILLFALFVALIVPITGVAVALQDFTLQPAAFAVRLLWETLTIGFSAVLQCALYIALRERREGPVTSHLSEIFA